MKKFIPIIGTISSGKSTFLKALLGINILETGISTTTKFVCLIQHNKSTKFYHIIPKKQGLLKFEKNGPEITEEENIRKKVEEINKNLIDKTITKDNIFYMLKIPLTYINNKILIENNYFLDIPGLNEYKSNYMDIIFSIITLDDILFEILIFDSTCISSDNIVKIIKNLESKKCLKKKENLFILNKIDKVKKKYEIIEEFRNNFYKNFEDDKNKKEKDTIFINIYENHFIPMNSLLYLAETRINENFSYLLQFEYFNFCENNKNNNVFSFSFYDFLKKKIDMIINPQDSKKPKISLNLNSFCKNDLENFKRSIEDFKIISGIHKIKNSNIENEFKSLYYLYKRKYYNFEHSEYYENLQNILNNINKIEYKSINKSYTLQNNINFDYFDINEKKLNLEMFVKFEKLLNEYLKLNISNNKDMSSIHNLLKNFNMKFSHKKLRIAFIGNINVGKSTVLNSIIGRNILPIDFAECTYRGIFIRHNESDEYKLYKIKMIRNTNLNEEFYFEEEKEPYCKGVLNIRNFLQNKNKDKKIEDEDAFFTITGRLKIFEYIKIHKYFMNKIEFIDLPGTDGKNNKFIMNNYLDLIVNYCNCCIYVNQPKTVEDKNSVDNIFYRRPNCYNGSNYMDYCLFLINKSDFLDDEEDKKKIISQIFKVISAKEKNIKLEDIHISFFSGMNFNKFLKAYNTYVYELENEPLKVLNEFYLDFNKNLYNAFGIKSLKQYILKEVEIIENEFDLDIDEATKIKIKPDFKKQINNAFSNLNYKIYIKDQETIIENLYKINKALKTKDFSGTIYSNEFFQKLKKVIINSEIFYIDSLKQDLEGCLKTIKKFKKNNAYNYAVNELVSILEKILA